MKLFTSLSDTHKERAIHMAEHIILGDLLKNGVQGEPETEEDKEQFALVNTALSHAKTMVDMDEQTEYLFENPATGELIFDKAYHIASTALYIEHDELAFHLAEIDSHFDDDDVEGEEVSASPVDEEKELSNLIKSAPKKDASQLN